MKHRARKRFGQNFLHDESVIEQIVRAINPNPKDKITEIGPGLSALTKPLIIKAKHVTVIEIDNDLAQNLSNQYTEDQITIINQDALEVDFNKLGQGIRLVGNLPYNISSPILFHLMQFADNIKDQHFMLQREVITRMVAQPGSSEYSRLSVMLQARYKMRHLFDVEPKAFDPQPNVMSAVVRMTPLPSTRPQSINNDLFENVVTKAFSQRRKMLRRSLSDWASLVDWDDAKIDPTSRAQDLSVQDFINLSDLLHKELLEK